MYVGRVDSNGRTLRVYDDRGGMLFMRTMPTRIEQVTVSGNLLSVVGEQGRLWVYELPKGGLKYTR